MHKPGIAQEWITSLDPQTMCMGMSQGKHTALEALRRRTARISEGMGA